MDSNEDKDDKLLIMSHKFGKVLKDRDQLQKENKELQNEILILQQNMRQMIPGFSNTSSSFPMFNELHQKINDYYKCICQDIFLDLLAPELNMEGIIYFYKTSFFKVDEILKNYFTPAENILKKTICINEIWSPIDNVLRKSYQANWKTIFSTINTDSVHHKNMLHLQHSLRLSEEEPQANIIIVDFLKKTLEIFFLCYISDPVIIFDLNTIGERILFSNTKNDSIDGFIKTKHESLLILPAVYKISINQENMLIKSQVLPLDYEFDNN
jgi:hypothetical protein